LKGKLWPWAAAASGVGAGPPMTAALAGGDAAPTKVGRRLRRWLGLGLERPQKVVRVNNGYFRIQVSQGTRWGKPLKNSNSYGMVSIVVRSRVIVFGDGETAKIVFKSDARATQSWLMHSSFSVSKSVEVLKDRHHGSTNQNNVQ
jgi:hypothetical protein